MTIKDAAERTGLSQKSIRYYESKGLLRVERGPENAYRQYTDEDIERLKEIFVTLKKEYFTDQPQFKEISMGMSEDYPIAIEEGATMVRVGTGIFGARNYNIN